MGDIMKKLKSAKQSWEVFVYGLSISQKVLSKLKYKKVERDSQL